MSQPEWTHLSPAAEQLSLGLEPLRPSEPSSSGISEQHQALLAELTQVRANEQQRTARIHHLERALDQALACLDEMRLRVQEQALLEAQLAATEKFSSVQQQAIARLKLRLKQQQQSIDHHISEAQDRDQAAHERLMAAEAVVQAQQGELDRLRAFLSDYQQGDETPHPLVERVRTLQANLNTSHQRLADLEAEAQSSQDLAERLQTHLEAAQQQIQDLSVTLGQYEARIAELEAALPENTDPSLLGKSVSLSRGKALTKRNRAIATLGQDLARAQIKVEELEIELSRQLRQQAVWQHNYQEIESECDRQRARAASLEHQAAEMQEQIFQQARQASEYEAAIQHWKDQYFSSQQQILYMKELLEGAQVQILASEDVDPILTAVFAELITTIELATSADHASQTAAVSPRFNLLDLPDFLLRRRTYRTR